MKESGVWKVGDGEGRKGWSEERRELKVKKTKKKRRRRNKREREKKEKRKTAGSEIIYR